MSNTPETDSMELTAKEILEKHEIYFNQRGFITGEYTDKDIVAAMVDVVIETMHQREKGKDATQILNSLFPESK